VRQYDQSRAEQDRTRSAENRPRAPCVLLHSGTNQITILALSTDRTHQAAVVVH
jgi:hypothetical protein